MKENAIKKGARKTLGGSKLSLRQILHLPKIIILLFSGGVSKVGGAILGVAGAIISLPAVLLSVPGLMIANRQRSGNEPHSLPYRIGTGIYVGVIGLVGLPAMIVSSLATGLRLAGDYAMKDEQVRKTCLEPKYVTINFSFTDI